jgi:peptidoglycan-associated lipoprotein
MGPVQPLIDEHSPGETMKRHLHLYCALAIAALAAGCSTPVKIDEKSEVPVETRAPTPVGGAGSSAAPGAAPQSQVTTVNVDKSAAAGVPRIVYFDYDSFAIKDEFRPLIEAQAKRLIAARTQRVAIEGHTDERGGREYNLALGQKRAEAVQRSLTLLGVAETQLESVSFGKERPAVQGSDEAAWAKNRRAELKDR